jgi:hypothetical protein
MKIESIKRMYLMFAILTLGLLSSCASKVPVAIDLPPRLPGPEELAKMQEMLALSLISYAGELLTGSDPEVETKLGPCLAGQLEYQPLTKNQWDLVWGPAVYKFNHAKLDDNLMFAVQHKLHKNEYAIVIRGTNGMAILDWIKEDLEVFNTKPWPYGNPPAGLKPKISMSTYLGLNILRQLKPSAGVLGQGLTIDQFLKQVTNDAIGDLNVHVTGHSLAGALSPTLTLWLADTQASWDPNTKAHLDVYAFAGPTAGDADFATYSESRIGEDTHRVYNPYDIVPKAWEIANLEQIPDLYSPDVKFPLALRLLLDVLKHKTKNLMYSQIAQQTPPIPGKLNATKTDFSAQAGWQHVCGYQCDLKIRDQFLEVPTKCDAPSGKIACEVCP